MTTSASGSDSLPSTSIARTATRSPTQTSASGFHPSPVRNGCVIVVRTTRPVRRRDLVDRLHAVVHERRRCDAPNAEVVVQREHAHRAARPPALVDLLGGPHGACRRVDDRRVPRDALPHRGTRRHDHEVRTLEPEQERVELVVSARHADDLGVAPVHRLELVERRLEGVGDAGERLADSALRHLEHQRLGAVQRLRDVVRRVVPHLGDVAGDADQAAQQGELVDDRGVVAGVRRRRRRRLDLQQRGASTDGVEQLGAAQLLGDRDRIDRLALAVQGHDRFVDVHVRGLVVIARFDVRFDGRGDRVAESSIAPRSDSSASRLCGGTRPALCRRASSIAWTTLLPSCLPAPPNDRAPTPGPSCRRSQCGAPPTRCLVPHPRRVGLWIDRAISLWIQGSCLHNPGDESLSFSWWGVTAIPRRDEHAGRSVAGRDAPGAPWGVRAGALVGDDVDGEGDLDVGVQLHRDLGRAELLQRLGELGLASVELDTRLRAHRVDDVGRRH